MVSHCGAIHTHAQNKTFVFAFDGSEIEAVTAVLFEETASEVLPTKLLRDDERTDKALLISPIAEIDVVLSSILF